MTFKKPDYLKGKLTQSYLRQLFDYHNGNLYWKVKPHRSHINISEPAGSVRGNRYRYVMIGKKSYPSHRLVWMWYYGSIPSGKFIDHIDCNPNNNDVANLRLATEVENNLNKRKGVRNTSGYKNVCWHIRQKKWVVGVTRNYKDYHIGSFANLEEAIAAADLARKSFHGEFARAQ